MWVTVTLHERLGHRMFQLATAYAYAQRTKRALVFTVNPEPHDFVPSETHDVSDVAWVDHKDDPFVHDAEIPIFDGEHVRLVGSFQSEHYWKDVVPHTHFTTPARCPRLPLVYQRIHSIALHARRGDDVSHPVPVAYYQRCLRYLRLKYEAPRRILVFSDDHTWCQQKLIPSCRKSEDTWVLMDQGSDEDQLHLMAQCPTIIMANSTYSWWAAYINNQDEKKDVFAPAQSDCNHIRCEWMIL